MHHGNQRLALSFLQSLVQLFPKGLFISHQYLVSLSMQCVCLCVCDTSSFHISISTAISHDLWLYLPKCAMLGCSHIVGLSGCSEACKASSGEVLLK